MGNNTSGSNRCVHQEILIFLYIFCLTLSLYSDAFTPFFCVNLPLNKSLADFKVSPNTISHQAASIWLQHHCHMLRLLLPSPAIHVLVNFVSKRFPITVTRIAGEPGVKSAWGIGVVDIVYFATAQCNTGNNMNTETVFSMSLKTQFTNVLRSLDNHSADRWTTKNFSDWRYPVQCTSATNRSNMVRPGLHSRM